MRKLAFFIMLAVFLCSLRVSAEENEVIPSSKAEVLMESYSGQCLIEENADQKLPIASLTKIMVLLIAAEEIRGGRLTFEDIVTASPHASSMDGSVIWLQSGEKMKAGDIIMSVVIASANDACVALAEHIGGNEEDFVARMNSKAEELGMLNTHFVNCVGYDDENHYSTARDVAIMCGELMKYDYYDEFMATRLTCVRAGTELETQLLNTNKLMNKYNGIRGGKTGTTDNAGYCLAECAERDGMRLISVVLGAECDEDRFSLCKKLLDTGFDGFYIYKPEFDLNKFGNIEVRDGVKNTVGIQTGEIKSIILKSGATVKYEYYITSFLTAPVTEGQYAGEIICIGDGETVLKQTIVTEEKVERLDFENSLRIVFTHFFRF